MTLNMIIFLTVVMLIMAVLTGFGILAGGLIVTVIFAALFCFGGYIIHMEWDARKDHNE